MKLTIRTINKSDTCIKVISKEILVLDQKNKKKPDMYLKFYYHMKIFDRNLTS